MTGAQTSAQFDHEDMLAALKAANAPRPIFGFGISTPDHVRAALAAGAAGVICGSAIVERIAAGQLDEACALVNALKAATPQRVSAEF